MTECYVKGAEMVEIAITDLIAIAISCVASGISLTTIVFVLMARKWK